MKMAAIVLAAGKSKRMGRNKLLLEVSGRSILDRILDTIDRSLVNEVIVVLGHQPETIKPIAEAHRATIIHNENYENGMTSSFQTGLHLVTADSAFLMLGDQLGLTSELLEKMAAMMETNPDVLIVSPLYRGKRGHPVLFKRILFPDILRLTRKETIRDIVLRYDDRHRFVEGDAWCVLDIDTPEDFQTAQQIFEVPD
jgi:molybdenum cofactor cytidylyltransferase